MVEMKGPFTESVSSLHSIHNSKFDCQQLTFLNLSLFQCLVQLFVECVQINSWCQKLDELACCGTVATLGLQAPQGYFFLVAVFVCGLRLALAFVTLAFDPWSAAALGKPR